MEDGDTVPATVVVTVRVNVAPSAIAMTSNDGTDTAAVPLPVPKRGETGTAITVADGDDADDLPDVFTVMDDEKNSAVKLADLDVLDQNMGTDAFGTHKILMTDGRFEIRKNG